VSVHGEYSRALESLVARVRCVAHEERERWLSALEESRVERNPDLTRAATRCREALAAMAPTLGLSASDASARDAEGLREPFEHLLAHCRIVLGLPSQATLGPDPR
jgi:hypothetical protein